MSAHQARYSAILLRPFKNEVIDAIVTQVNEVGHFTLLCCLVEIIGCDRRSVSLLKLVRAIVSLRGTSTLLMQDP